jgi:branched-chain amino acid transport system permease protein
VLSNGRRIAVLWIAVVLVAALLPFVASDSPFILALATRALIAAIVALSLDLLMGNTGLLSFGHAGWYGLGAYAAGLAAKYLSAEILIVLPLAAVTAAILAASFGSILTQQIGKTFAILTLALSQIFYSFIFVAAKWTGGEDGLQGIPIPTLFGFPIISPAAGYWLLLVVLASAIAFALFIRQTPLGRAWLAIKDNAERAQFIGIHTARLKLLAYVLSASLAAIAGGLFSLLNGATSPETLHWFESGKMLMYVVLGGVGTIVGPVIGALTFTVAEHYVSSLTGAWLIYFGGLFVLVVIVAPGGLFGLLSRLRARPVNRRGGQS